MIEFKNVSFSYTGQDVLKDVTFSIDQGEFVALIGANGAGKTTMSKLFNGLNKPTKGSVSVNDLDTGCTKTSLLARHIGFLFQNPDRQICCDTIEREILFGMRCVGIEELEAKNRADEMIREFGFDPARNPMTASRGERQRIALASLLAIRPEVLVLDEPTTGLDYRECMHIMDIISRLNRENHTTVVMVSHDMELVQDFAERIFLLKDGRLIADGPVKTVMQNSALLAESDLLPAQIVTLAGMLGEGFRDIFTYTEMADEIERRLRA